MDNFAIVIAERIIMDKIINVETPLFNGKLKVVKKQYGNGRLALTLEDPEDGSPWFTATVNLPEEAMPIDHAFMKGYSENEGLPEALVKAGVVELTGKKVKTGFVEVEIAKILI